MRTKPRLNAWYAFARVDVIRSDRVAAQIANGLHCQRDQIRVGARRGTELQKKKKDNVRTLIDLSANLDLVRFHHFLNGRPYVTQPHVDSCFL
jgi:hypothetical protein